MGGGRTFGSAGTVRKTLGKNMLIATGKYCSTFLEPLESCHKIVSAAVPSSRTRRPNNWMLMIVSIGTLDTTVLDKPCFKDPIYMSATHVVPDDL